MDQIHQPSTGIREFCVVWKACFISSFYSSPSFLKPLPSWSANALQATINLYNGFCSNSVLNIPDLIFTVTSNAVFNRAMLGTLGLSVCWSRAESSFEAILKHSRFEKLPGAHRSVIDIVKCSGKYRLKYFCLYPTKLYLLNVTAKIA